MKQVRLDSSGLPSMSMSFFEEIFKPEMDRRLWNFEYERSGDQIVIMKAETPSGGEIPPSALVDIVNNERALTGGPAGWYRRQRAADGCCDTCLDGLALLLEDYVTRLPDKVLTGLIPTQQVGTFHMKMTATTGVEEAKQILKWIAHRKARQDCSP